MDGRDEWKTQNLLYIGPPEYSPPIATSSINIPILKYSISLDLIDIPSNPADSPTHSYFPSLEAILAKLFS